MTEETPPEDAPEAAPESTQATLDLTSHVTTPEGLLVPIEISVKYPRNYGVYAVQAVVDMHGHVPNLYASLIEMGDVSAISTMLAPPSTREIENPDELEAATITEDDLVGPHEHDHEGCCK